MEISFFILFFFLCTIKRLKRGRNPSHKASAQEVKELYSQLQKMCNSLKMALSLSSFLFVSIFAEVDECKESRCAVQGPSIRFPFWLKDHQPDHCGYPGFKLSCSEKNQTMLHLSHSVKLLVRKIDYKSQEILVHDQDDCRLTQFLILNLSSSPFHFLQENQVDYSLFNCSSTKTDSEFQPVPCLSVPAYPVYAVTSWHLIRYLNLSSCLKIHISLPYQTLEPENLFTMNWVKPMCKSCETEGKKCRLKKSSSEEPHTECIKGTIFCQYPTFFHLLSNFLLKQSVFHVFVIGHTGQRNVIKRILAGNFFYCYVWLLENLSGIKK